MEPTPTRRSRARRFLARLIRNVMPAIKKDLG
jgi:hypothetical protein